MEQGAVIKHNLKNAPVTGYWRYAKPRVDKKKCAGCGVCVKFCPEACIKLTTSNKQLTTDKKEIAEIDYYFCKGCGVCARECPRKAIKMEKESASERYRL